MGTTTKIRIDDWTHVHYKTCGEPICLIVMDDTGIHDVDIYAPKRAGGGSWNSGKLL